MPSAPTHIPDIISLCETHVRENAQPPTIPGYNSFYNNYSGGSSGTAIYYRLHLKATQLVHPGNANKEMKARVTMERINNTWYGEFYAPCDSENVEPRENFYAYAEEAVAAMRENDRTIPMILVGDFNGHIKDHYSMETNSNGQMILDAVKNQSLELINMNSPTWERPGRRPTCVDYVACNKTGYDKILKSSVRDEIYIDSDHHLIEITMNASLLLLVEQPQQR